MNPATLLHRAALAAVTDRRQEYFLAAIGLRADGAIVCATNQAAGMRGGKIRLWSTHAEARLCKKLDYGATVFVARILTTGWAMAKPCPRCESLLRRRNVKTVYYTTGPNTYEKMELK